MGDGGSIKIWEYNWLLDPSNSRVVSPRNNIDAIYVKELFFADRRIWDPGLVESIFLPWEAEMIQRILVSEGYVEDLLIWPLTPDGNYSVQSAYRMLETNARFLSPCTSSTDGRSKVWKGIWKIKTPNRIRHFIWWAAIESLPTKQNLKQRHVPVEASCALCDEHTESLIHCVWLCDHAQVLELYLKSNNSRETNIIHLSINNCIMCICNKNQQ